MAKRELAGTDVAVIGGGIFGLASAYACARRGLSVRLFEQDRIGAGASGGIVGALSPHMPDQWNGKKQFQFEALAAAGAFWREVEETSGLSPGYRRSGRLIPLVSQAARDRAALRSAAAQAVWGKAGAFEVTPLDCPDWLAAEAGPFGCIRDTLAGRIQPRQALRALAQAAQMRGVEIAEGVRIRSAAPGRVDTDDGPSAAGSIILAGGVGASGLGLPQNAAHRIAGVKGQAALLAAAVDPGRPTIFADGVYIVAHEDGRVAVGSTSEPQFTHADPDPALDDLLARAQHICPALRGAAVLERWAGLRPKAPRRDPVLGPVPGMPGVFIANGAFKIGFGIAHKVGETLAGFVSGAAPDIPASFTFQHHFGGQPDA